MNRPFLPIKNLTAGILLLAGFALTASATAKDLAYTCSTPPLEVTFSVKGGHYNGAVNRGNLFLETDIPTPPLVRWQNADPKKLYTLMMIDFDGNANGSWPDAVASGKNSPVRHGIVGNIPGALLRGKGYNESKNKSKVITVLQAYRAPHIPVVSDRYGVYLFEQKGPINFHALTGPITNFDHRSFLRTYGLRNPVASNFFIAVYVSESPFSGKAFHGNDVSGTWHKGYGMGRLTP